MRGLPDELTRDGVSPLGDVEKLVIEGRYGRADLALRRLEALIPSLAQSADNETLLLALYGRALLLRQLNAGTQEAIAACDVLERAAHEREAELWVATACALRARFRVDSGDIGGATADLARADAEVATGDLTTDTGYRLLDGLALVYAGLRLHDRGDEVRTRIEHSIQSRRVLDQAQHWSTWSGELAARAMEPLAGGAQEPHHELMGRAIEIAARLDELPEAEVPATLRRGARGVRALSAAYRGRPSEALRLLGPDAFGTVGDLPLVERQVVSLAAMRAHALVGSLATARSLDDAATGATPATLPNLVLEVCRTRERLWLETYAGGDVIPVLHRMTELLVRLGWRGMDLVADTARQALEHQALRTESRTDALTGVGNRRALDEELRQLLRFGPLPLALILVDIDHFKDVNDRFTHVVGDEVLRRVAASLSLQLRTDDQLLRYGGDEFVVLLPGTGDEEANAVAERMRDAVAARPWGELADGLLVTVTTGVAAVWSLSGRRPDADAEKLFRRADERLLDGKRSRPEESRGRSRSGAPAPAPREITAVTDDAFTDDAVTDDATASGMQLPILAGVVSADTGSDRPRPRPQPLKALSSETDSAVPEEQPVVDLSVIGRPLVDLSVFYPSDRDSPTAEPASELPVLPVKELPVKRQPSAEPLTEILPILTGLSSLSEDEDDELLVADPRRGSGSDAASGSRSDAASRSGAGSGSGSGAGSRSGAGGGAARPRDLDRAATLARPERRGRTVFDPDPDIDLDAATPAPSAAPRPSGRRDGRPRPADHTGLPGHSEDTAQSAIGSVTPMRSRREARAASKPDASTVPETSASREAAEMDAAAREVAQAKADEARQRTARDVEARERAVRDQAAREAAVEARKKAEREAEARAKVDRERVEAERLQAERLQAERAEAERAQAERERLAHQAAREAEARAQAEAREAEVREKAAREAEVRAQAERDRMARELEARERAERERLAYEQAEHERRERELAAREQAAREQLIREQAERERAIREAEARARAEAREQAAREQAAREQAEREAAAREQAAREQAARERAAREQAARERAAREQAERERAAREQAERERAAREQAEREAAAREQIAREAAAREQAAREQAERERLAREQAAREQAEREWLAREQAAREAEARAQAEREQAAREQAERELAERVRLAREAEARERIAREAEAREQAARERIAREAEAREQAARERIAREAEEREQEARRQAIREQIAREAEERERAALEQAERDRAARETEARERAERERAAREQELREAAAREQIAREQAARERAAREQAAREQAAREGAAREKAAREAAELERRRQAERARAEAEARAEMQRREAEARVRAERVRAERERREAEARAAEQIKQEARARVEREARAAQQIREEAYARAAEQARLAASGGYTTDRYQPSGYDRNGQGSASYDSGTHRAAPHTSDPMSSGGGPAPSLRRAPLYDSNHYSDSDDLLAAGDKQTGNRAKDEAVETEVEQGNAGRARRDPFGPPTSRQAIIDLSARKRPRTPYSP